MTAHCASRVLVCTLLVIATRVPLFAQDHAYFVTYDHYLEEPGALEIAVASTIGGPRNGQRAYIAPWLEVEYGVTGWWTTEVYLESVHAGGQGSAFTGWRWENRFRLLDAEHRVTPVLYVEYEHINEASRIQKEIVGDGPLHYEPIGELREEHAHEIEGKLILSSTLGSWNLAENLIFEKNLSEDEGVELGYSVGVSRALGAVARGASCRWCPERFRVGVEAYGGLGTTDHFGAAGARHYVAPVVAWRVTSHSTVKVSTAAGLTDVSDRYLLRLGWSYELPLGRRQ
jgi:hypothetical protein